MNSLNELAAKALHKLAEDIKAGNTELSDSEAMDLMALATHRAMSKASACIYLNISRSRFDDLVRENKLPKGKKRVGFKELVWYKDELDECIRKFRG